jgi:hypothetical protein
MTFVYVVKPELFRPDAQLVCATLVSPTFFGICARSMTDVKTTA